MGARESKEMKKARTLVKNGSTAYAAAKICGITKQAIYVSRWYKELKQPAKIAEEL